ncbi:uncharacterized protein LOC143728367 [Siphateles boraxobius]|uniref:uncharacterized protein LOC143728367 n=1 Tax=Siphateles boraxobius TaxID=180520 RepID=UPI00406451C6
MKFQVLLLAFALVIATNIHCQAQLQLRDSDESPEVKGHVMSRRQVRSCNCSGRRTALDQNCPCELQRHRFLSKEKLKAFCQKKGSATSSARSGAVLTALVTSKKCQQLTGGLRKQKKANNGISMPI